MVEEQNMEEYFFSTMKDSFEYINRGSDNNLYQVKWSSLIKNKKKLKKY